MPLDGWLRGDLRSMAADLLLSQAARARGYVRADEVRRIFDEHMSGAASHGHRLWACSCSSSGTPHDGSVSDPPVSVVPVGTVRRREKRIRRACLRGLRSPFSRGGGHPALRGRARRRAAPAARRRASGTNGPTSTTGSRRARPTSTTTSKGSISARFVAALVLDAGCGMGRHARQIAPHAGRLVAVDFSRAIDQACRNTAAPRERRLRPGRPARIAAGLTARSTSCTRWASSTTWRRPRRRWRASSTRSGPAVASAIYLYWKRHGWRAACSRW